MTIKTWLLLIGIVLVLSGDWLNAAVFLVGGYYLN